MAGPPRSCGEEGCPSRFWVCSQPWGLGFLWVPSNSLETLGLSLWKGLRLQWAQRLLGVGSSPLILVKCTWASGSLQIWRRVWGNLIAKMKLSVSKILLCIYFSVIKVVGKVTFLLHKRNKTSDGRAPYSKNNFFLSSFPLAFWGALGKLLSLHSVLY